MKTLVFPWLAFMSLAIFGACGSSTRQHNGQLPGQWYTVRKGDSVASIARQFNAYPNDIIELNGLNKEGEITPEQSLFIYRDPDRSMRPVKHARSTVARRPPKKLSTAKGNGWIWPLRNARISSGYGRRGNRPHKGIDLVSRLGAPIYAVRSGVVIYSGSRQRGYGNLVILQHKDKYVTVYAHNRRNLVDEGAKVGQGEQIAELGNTGRSTGPHLHFEIRYQGKPINPMTILKHARQE